MFSCNYFLDSDYFNFFNNQIIVEFILGQKKGLFARTRKLKLGSVSRLLFFFFFLLFYLLRLYSVHLSLCIDVTAYSRVWCIMYARVLSIFKVFTLTKIILVIHYDLGNENESCRFASKTYLIFCSLFAHKKSLFTENMNILALEHKSASLKSVRQS